MNVSFSNPLQFGGDSFAYPTVLYHQGMAYYSNEEREKTREALSKTLKISDTSPEPRRRRN